MPVYVTLYKFTDQGIKDVKNVADRFGANVKAFEAMGGKLLGFYATMGEYDYVGIAEAPNDEVAMITVLNVGTQGIVRTTTMKAFSMEQFIELVKKIP